MKDMCLNQLLKDMIVKVSVNDDLDKDFCIVVVKDMHYLLFCIPNYEAENNSEH